MELVLERTTGAVLLSDGMVGPKKRVAALSCGSMTGFGVMVSDADTSLGG